MAWTQGAAWPYADSYAFMERVRQGMPPVIICVAVNGGIHGKEYNEALPETADEIADSVGRAYDAGAAMVHVHARDPTNLPAPARTVEVWHEVNAKIRERCPDIIINDTTGGGFGMTMEERLACLDANPEMASLNLAPDMSRFRIIERKPPLPYPRTAIDYDDCVPFTYGQISWYAAEMKKRGVKPELEVCHPGCAWVIRDLIEQDLVAKPYWIQTIMGYQTSSFPTVHHVLDLLRDFPDGAVWLCSGTVRVGLEDDIYYRRGEKAKSNAQLVERAARIAHELNREIATPAHARAMLGMSGTPSRYGR